MVEEKQKVTLTKLKVKVQKKDGRGASDLNPSEVLDLLRNVWDEIQTALYNLSEEDQKTYRDYFNTFDDDYKLNEGLGDILFGDKDDFQLRVNCLDAETRKKYLDELVEQELFTLENLEDL